MQNRTSNPPTGLTVSETSTESDGLSTRSTRTTLAIGDAASAIFAVVLATIATEGFGGFLRIDPFVLGLAGALGLIITLWWRNSYAVSRSIRWDGNFVALLSSVGGVSAAMVCASWFFMMDPARLWQLIISGVWVLSLGLLRFVLSRQNRSTARPVRVIVAGNTGDALATRLALRADPRTTYDVQGFVMDHLDDSVPDIVSQLALGSIDHLPHLAQKSEADLVVVCLGAIDAERFAPLARELNFLGVEVALSTGLSDIALRRVSLGHVSGRPLVRVTPAPLGGWHFAVKRLLDVIGATLLLIVTSPVMLAATIAIRIEDGGRAFFRQTRVGRGGDPFTIYKFRTMTNDAEELLIDLTNDLDGPVFKMQDDPRVTRVGRILRTTSVDELPQIINILRGEMSLVGPRPLPVHEVDAAPTSFLDRHAVKPGLTGRWQVSGRSNTGFDELDELDRWYVDNWSLGQDLEILARTVPAVLLARGAR